MTGSDNGELSAASCQGLPGLARAHPRTRYGSARHKSLTNQWRNKSRQGHPGNPALIGHSVPVATARHSKVQFRLWDGVVRKPRSLISIWWAAILIIAGPSSFCSTTSRVLFLSPSLQFESCRQRRSLLLSTLGHAIGLRYRSTAWLMHKGGVRPE